MQKIFEISSKEWLKALSHRDGYPIGGILKLAIGFNPFKKVGYFEPSYAVTELTAPATNPVKVITPFIGSANASMFYAHSESKLYQYLVDSPYTQTDVSAQVSFADSFYDITGAILWRNRYVYSLGTSVRSAGIPVSGDVEILAGSQTSSMDIRKLSIGADKNLYVADYECISKCVIATGTTGAVAQIFLVNINHTVRDLLNDGRYLVILSDDNKQTNTSRIVGNFSCKVYFWDMKQATADVIWDIPGESYVIGMKQLGNLIYIFGYNGIYVCNSATQPSMIFSFLDDCSIPYRPTSPYQISAGNNCIFWGDGGTNGKYIFALGSVPGITRVFFSPYITHGSSAKHTAIKTVGNSLVAATDAPKIYLHNVGSTAGNSSFGTVPLKMSQLVTMGFVKVSLRKPLSSGQSVTMSLDDGDVAIISDSQTISYNASKPLKTLIFPVKAIANSEVRFETLSINLSQVAGVSISRIAIYGTPVDDTTQI